MAYVFLLLGSLFLSVPLLLYNDAMLGEFVELYRYRAEACAEHALSKAITRIKTTPTFQGTYRQQYPDGFIVYQIGPPLSGPPWGEAKEVIGLGYWMTTSRPRAVRRIHAIVQTTDGGLTWHVMSKQIMEGVGVWRALPINERTGRE